MENNGGGHTNSQASGGPGGTYQMYQEPIIQQSDDYQNKFHSNSVNNPAQNEANNLKYFQKQISNMFD